MFGLTQLFSAIARLTQSISTMADHFDAANQHISQRFTVDPDKDVHPALAEETKKNGRKRIEA